MAGSGTGAFPLINVPLSNISDSGGKTVELVDSDRVLDSQPGSDAGNWLTGASRGLILVDWCRSVKTSSSLPLGELMLSSMSAYWDAEYCEPEFDTVECTRCCLVAG